MKVFEKSRWIGTGETLKELTYSDKSPVLQLRNTFNIDKIKNPVCRISGLGFYTLYINGLKVGNDVLSPAFTVYDKRVLYVEYNLSEYIKVGKNVVCVKLGNGFYNQSTHDEWGFYKATWRDNQKLLFEIIDNNNTVLVSDENWKYSLDGPTVYSAVRIGEYYDARKIDNWLDVGFNDDKWRNAKIVNMPDVIIEKTEMPLTKECESFYPVSIKSVKDCYLIDFGKNISGYIEFSLYGKRGNQLIIRYGEKLKDGMFTQKENACFVYDTEFFSTDKYIFGGKGKETWKPEFVYHGFRYVLLQGIDYMPDYNDIKAHFVHTDLVKKGDFDCSNTLFNWIYDAGIRSFLSNYIGFPTDCPHREKNGWTGDASLSCNYAVYNFDMKKSYKKWLIDIIDCQKDNGEIPCIAPTSLWGYDWGNGPAWDSALFFIPYELYFETGDKECIKVVYNACKKYLNYADTKIVNGLANYGLGDWCYPKNIDDLKIMDNMFSDSCYLYKMYEIAAKMAELLNDSESITKYSERSEIIKNAILNKYVDKYNVDNNGQGALSTVLYFGLVKGEQAKQIALRLVDVIKKDNYVFKVGILGMKSLLNALSLYGYTNVAYKMVNRTNYPSYGFWKNSGATTLWENWDGSNSQNHHMYGDVLNWQIRNVIGLRNSGVAYDKCLIEPYFFDERCYGYTKTIVNGNELSIRWDKNRYSITLKAIIPIGVDAKIKLPNGKLFNLEVGKKEYIFNLL